MKRIIFLLTLSLALTSSCTIPASCKLYNNSYQNLKVIKLRGDIQEFAWDFESQTAVEIENCRYSSIKIFSDSQTWRYETPSLDSSFIEFVGWGPWTKRIFKAQWEPDGRIYALPAGKSFPMRLPGKQPEGFPMEPVR